ncbi:MAG: lytic transglycosylase domain-containing protein [Christensenella sp.]|uniref:lytic transglycosylase domain-containing protein n=1 Tax=Christensenella sp. TaxID=1935934 RepID=UPI002B218AC7|nr:lytic transglycosylase domain-containing protein [Christensenella sp.]MEA5002769.1 lytic transglycosylase domain-containing protein [Christensenella sp.]
MGRANSRKKGSKAVIIVVCVVIAVAAVLGGLFVFGDLNWQAKYPLKYEELIVKYADEYALDPYFVAAVIHTESGFDAEAVSGAGAMGLMQVMPETGEWVAGKLGLEGFNKEMLLDPETNIEMGCWYLGFLKERFPNEEAVMAAYNAGHGRVQEWLDDAQYSTDGTTLDSIPFKETENYVKKVTNAYEKYKEHYELG